MRPWFSGRPTSRSRQKRLTGHARLSSWTTVADPEFGAVSVMPAYGRSPTDYSTGRPAVFGSAGVAVPLVLDGRKAHRA
jgi:hypothetical protein